MDTSDFEYAGFWIRVWAALIDTVLVLLVTLPLLFALYGSAYWSSETFVHGPVDWLISGVLPAVAVLAFWVARQATPGKLAISARIVDADTRQNASTAQLLGRYFGYFLSVLPLFLGIVWVAFDERKQGWHDKLAGTVVLRKRPSV